MTPAAAQRGSTAVMLPHRGYDPAWFEVFAKVEERHFWFRARNEIIAGVIGQIAVEFGAGLRLLEVGCGNGNVLRRLKQVCPQARLVGLDFFKEGLDHARKRCDCELVHGDLFGAPFASGSFNVIGMFDVLEHVQDDRAALCALYSLLAPGGALVLTVPACPALWSYFDEVAGHYRRYRTTDLTEKLHETGFLVSRMTHFMMSLFPLMWGGRRWAGRRRQSARRAETDPFVLAQDELKIRPVFNQMLFRLTGWERRWVGSGGRLPCGTSLLVVARKPSAQVNGEQSK
jgi:SAM-dependent methyltransferase